MANKIKKIAVFTSGGDSPGMNAAIRSVVRDLRIYETGMRCYLQRLSRHDRW